MGTFTYDSGLAVHFDDRVLAHIQLVIGAKLRRSECFYFSWKSDMELGGGQTTVWIHPSVSLMYQYPGGKMPMIDRSWIEALSVSANSPGGLHLVPEPDRVKHSDAGTVDHSKELMAHRS